MALPFALALHELCTNAAKYGALATENGRVAIEWGFSGGEDDTRMFDVEWSETNGPAVAVPDRQGFGSRVIKRAFAAIPGGHAAIEYRPDGLRCRFRVPAGQVAAEARPQAEPAGAKGRVS